MFNAGIQTELFSAGQLSRRFYDMVAFSYVSNLSDMIRNVSCSFLARSFSGHGFIFYFEKAGNLH